MGQNSSALKAIRGMNDTLPDEVAYWHHIEQAARHLMQQYAYEEIRFPVVEQTQLFKRTIGDATDIIAKEMYTFEDRNGDSLSLRPEGTACCVRAGIQNSLFYNQTQRLWYMGPMFRHERPQKGRYRQFYQFGVEAFGMPGPEIDVEHLLIQQRLWQNLGLTEHVKLELNTLGNETSRTHYRQALVNYFTAHKTTLDEDSLRRLATNPLRILDSKAPSMQDLIAQAPRLLDYLDDTSTQHFEGLCALLDQCQIPYHINPRIVRGLDYYGFTVYEWTTDLLGAQSAICAGGHYDNLVEQLGGQATPAVGFAIGLERLVLILQTQTTLTTPLDLFFILEGQPARQQGLLIAEQLRKHCPQLRIKTTLMPKSLKSQLKQADKSGATYAIIIGEQEQQANQVTFKPLRDRSQNQCRMDINQLLDFFHPSFNPTQSGV